MAILCMSISVSAYDFEVDGFYYEVDLEKMTATLVAGENKQVGEIYIPATVAYKDREFTVTSINGAFSGNDELTNVSIPSTVTFLGERTFNGCTNLISVSTLNNIVEIGESCFSDCEKLSMFDFSKELKTIGSRAFNGCKALSELIVPESVDSIGVEVFKNCINLSTVVLPSTISYIPNGLFKNCESLVNVGIPSSITTINDEVFSGCKSLSSIVIPANVKKIDNGVFNGCSSIKSVRLEDSEEAITLGYGRVTNKRVLGLFYDLPVEDLYLGRDLDYPDNESLFLDAHYEGYAPFQSCPINEVTISKSVRRINPYTFYSCTNLNEVTIPPSVASIGVYAFAKSGIRTFTIEDAYRSISFGVTESDDLTTLFMGCNDLKNIKIGRNIVVSDQKSPGWMVSNDLKIPSLFPQNIENIEIGNYVDELSWLLHYKGTILSSLENYHNIKTLKLGCCIGYIPCLANNMLLEELIINSTIPVHTSPDTFSNAQYMDLSIKVPVGCETTYNEAEVWNKFWDLSTQDNLLSNVVLYNNQIYGFLDENNIGLLKSPFGLEEWITIPQTIDYNGGVYRVTSIGRAFKNNHLIRGVDIRACIDNLESECFKGCAILEKVNLGEGLTKIPNAAFYDCVSLISINIPQTVEAIGAYAFYNCSSINTLTIPAVVTSFGLHAFEYSSIKNLLFEDGDGELDLPPSSTQSKELHGSYNYNGWVYTNLGYFANTNIESLYLGRNIKDKDITIKYGGTTYFTCFDDPFYNISSLKIIKIGENVTRIGSRKRTVSEHGMSVSNNVSFSKCNNVDSVLVKANIPPIDAKFSDNTYKYYGSLVVPSGTIETYKSTDGWKEFKYIIEDTSGVESIVAGDNLSIEVYYDGIIYNGDNSVSILIYGIDGKCHYAGTISSGQFIALSKGIYIVTLDDKSIKVKI